MPAVLFYEPYGVFIGTLQEDMIDTVVKFKRPFIDVLYESRFSADFNYPLTYVPMHLMCLPLRKGTKILAKFNQSELYPVLYKLADENLDEIFINSEKQVDLPESGDLIEWPDPQPTLSVIKLSDMSWVITTDSVDPDEETGKDSELDGASYTIIRRGLNTILLGGGKEDKDGLFLVGTATAGFHLHSDLKIEVDDSAGGDGKINILVKNGVNLESSDGGLDLKVKKAVNIESTDDSLSQKASKSVSIESSSDSMSLKSSKDLTAESSTGKISLSGSSGASLDGKTGKVSVKNSVGSLAKVLDSLLQSLSSTQPCTMGSPAAHMWNPGILQAIIQAKTQLSLIME